MKNRKTQIDPKCPRPTLNVVAPRTGNEIIRAAEPTLTEQINAVESQEESIRSSYTTQGGGPMEEIQAEWDAHCLKAAVATLKIARKCEENNATIPSRKELNKVKAHWKKRYER